MSQNAIRILLIEDNDGDARLIREMLRDAGVAFELDRTATLGAGLERIDGSTAEVVLLDLSLPDSRGIDTFVRAQARAPHLPIVVMSGLNDETVAMQAVHSGAQDYLVKGQVDGALLSRAIRYAIERKQTEERIRANEKLLNEVQKITHLGSWQWTPQDDVVSWSDELYRIYGLEPQSAKMTFAGYLERVHPDDRERVRAAVEQALRDHRPFDFEERIVRPDGSVRWIQSLGEIVVSPAGKPVRLIGACQDITERKRADVELAQARDAALESARLKSAFLANMSHEIRTPLHILLGYHAHLVELFKRFSDRDETPLLDAVARAGDRLLNTIGGILDLSKIETGNFDVAPKPLLLGELVKRQVEEFQVLAARKGLRLSCSIEEPDAVVSFDEYCCSHALGNLLDNAIKFTREGGVSARLYRDAGGVLCLDVRDTGVGIDAEYLPRIFEPFSQEEVGYTRRFEGSGLGLALTKNFLELNDAALSVESEKGRGSLFRIRIPRSREVAPAAGVPAAAPPPPADHAQAPGARSAILVVEDDPETQVYMRLLLGERHEVFVAESGKQARAHLAALGSSCAAVLMDLSLKGSEDGLTLARALRADPAWRDLTIVATTAHGFVDDRDRALAAGCDAYLAKPFRQDELFAVLDRFRTRRERCRAAAAEPARR